MDVPIELQTWNYAQCAEYFGCTKEHFARRIATRPDFPRRLDIIGRPRYAAKDVIGWALSRRVA